LIVKNVSVREKITGYTGMHACYELTCRGVSANGRIQW